MQEEYEIFYSAASQGNISALKEFIQTKGVTRKEIDQALFFAAKAANIPTINFLSANDAWVCRRRASQTA